MCKLGAFTALLTQLESRLLIFETLSKLCPEF